MVRDAATIQQIGGALAELFEDEPPTVVMGTQSRGSLLGVLTAQSAGVGFAEVRKKPGRAADSDAWWGVHGTGLPGHPPKARTTPVASAVRRSCSLVDDWIATGAQAQACRQIVEMSGARWIGAAVIVDAVERSELRRILRLRSLLHVRDLRAA